jgi:hypothetical protein
MKRLSLLLSLIISTSLLAACQSPCERPVANGYTRFTPQAADFALGFDFPSEWSMKVDRSVQKADPSGDGLNALVEFQTAPVERYPYIYSNGKILSEQEWGSPFPGRAMQIESKEIRVGGYPGMTVRYDFDAPLVLMDGTSPVTSWGYMQFTFIVVGNLMYDIRFYASDNGQEELLQKEFDKLVKSICILPTGGSNDD